MVEKHRRLAPGTRRRAAARYALGILVRVKPWRCAGMTLQACADRLNAQGLTTFTGHPWSPARLCQVIRRGRIAAEHAYISTQNDTWLRHAMHVKGEEADGTAEPD